MLYVCSSDVRLATVRPLVDSYDGANGIRAISDGGRRREACVCVCVCVCVVGSGVVVVGAAAVGGWMDG